MSRLHNPFAERAARKVVLAVSLTAEQAEALDILVSESDTTDRSKYIKQLLEEKWARRKALRT